MEEGDGMRDGQGGMTDAVCARRDAGCARRDAGCEMRDAVCARKEGKGGRLRREEARAFDGMGAASRGGDGIRV
jgi:hypothetical protein